MSLNLIVLSADSVGGRFDGESRGGRRNQILWSSSDPVKQDQEILPFCFISDRDWL